MSDFLELPDNFAVILYKKGFSTALVKTYTIEKSLYRLKTTTRSGASRLSDRLLNRNHKDTISKIEQYYTAGYREYEQNKTGITNEGS